MEEFNSIKNRPKILNTNQKKSPSRLFFNSVTTSSPCHQVEPVGFHQKLRKSYNFNTLTNSKPIKTFHLTSSKSVTNDMDSFIYPSSMSPESTISSISSVSTLSNDNSANINKIQIENMENEFKSKIYITGQSNINRIEIGAADVVPRRHKNPTQCDNDARIKRAMSTCLNVNQINKFIEPKVNIDASTFKQPLLPITSNNLPLSSFRNSLLIEKSPPDAVCDDNKEKTMSKSAIYQLSSSTKRWRSMYALRDSIRNLTSCVSSKASFINYKKNAPIIKINSQFGKNSEESLKECEYFEEEMSVDTDVDAYSYCGASMISVRDTSTGIGTSGSYLKCKTSDNLYESNRKIDQDLIGNVSHLLANKSVFSSCNYLSPRSHTEQNMSVDLHPDEIRPITNSNTSVNTIKKIKIKKKKSAQKQKERAYLAKNDDLYDMIEKIQGDRLDNQRCELAQDCSVTKFFDDKYSLLNETKMINRVSNTLPKSSTARLESMLAKPGLYPMVSLPDNDNYWCEGWKVDDDASFAHDLVISSSSLSSPSSSLSSSSSPSPSAESYSYGFKVISSNFDNGADNIREAFMGNESLVFFGRNQLDEPFVLSYSNQAQELRAILRLKDTNYLISGPLSSLEEPVQPEKIVQLLQPEFRAKFIYPLVNLNGFNLINDFDNHSISKQFKFGVIYMKKGQTTEEELFSNQEHSEEFDNFLAILGDRIKLKDFDGFRGGLDTSHGQTGEYSIYEQFQDKEIMFHVSTLLPYNKNDSQQLERKRHIGNDIVAIVFQEGNTPFAPDMIASNFLHAFIVVQKFDDPSSSKKKYRISVAARKDVPNFGPPISNDSIFDNDYSFKDWLLNKLINAEYSCYKAEKFKKLKERTRSSLFDKLYNDLNLQNQSVLSSLFPNLSETSAITDTTSTRLTNETSSSSSSGSPIISSANSTSTHNLTSSTSFKFSLINTVRKAFKKDSKDKDLHSSRSSLSKPRSGTASAVLLTSPSSSPSTTPSNENHTMSSKLRSMTFDSGTDHSAYGQATIKSQLKNQISAPEQINKKIRFKYLNNHEHHLAKIGSIDSLNNVEKEDILKKRLFSLIPPKNTNGSMTDLTNKSYASSSGSSLPEDEIDEQNDSILKNVQVKS